MVRDHSMAGISASSQPTSADYRTACLSTREGNFTRAPLEQRHADGPLFEDLTGSSVFTRPKQPGVRQLMRIRTLVPFAGSSLLLIASAVSAQTPAAPSDSADLTTVGLEEIVVTARRRSESLQDVPQTVDVVTAEDVSKLNFQQFTDVVAIVPGLTMTQRQHRLHHGGDASRCIVPGRIQRDADGGVLSQRRSHPVGLPVPVDVRHRPDRSAARTAGHAARSRVAFRLDYGHDAPAGRCLNSVAM